MEFSIPRSLEESWDFFNLAWSEGVFGAGYDAVFYAAAALLVALVLRGLFARWILRMIRAAAAGTSSKIDDVLVDALSEPLKLVFLIIGLDIAVRIMTLAPDGQALADQVIRSLIAIAVFWALHRVAGAMRIALEPLAVMLTPSAVDWLVKALQVIFLIVGVASVLEIWGVRVAPLLAGLGIFGVAVALGAQDLFKNLIAGLAVMAEKRFRRGDWIKVDGVVEGVVEQINFRSTVVRRFDKGPVYVPNAVFSDNALINFSRMSHRRIYMTIGVEYGTSVEQLRAIRGRIEAYLFNNPDIAQPPEASLFVHVDAFAASSIDFMIYCFTKTTNWGEWLAIKEAFALEIKTIVESEGAAFAFPSRTLYMAPAAAEQPERFVPPQTATQPAQAQIPRPPRPQNQASAGGE
jgi:MscS family membrane protein